MELAAVDAITAEELRAAGSVKWSIFPDSIGAFVAEMDFGVAPSIRSALVSALDKGLTGYLPPSLTAQLQLETAEWCSRRYGWEVEPERVRPVADVIAALELTIEHFTTPGSAVIVPTPSYMPFLTVPVLHGRRVIQVPHLEVDGRPRLDLEAIAAAFDDGGELFVLCNPHNPLGVVFTTEELLELSVLVEAKGGRVFNDEIHAPLVYDGARHVPYPSVSPAAAAHAVTATAASKAWNLAGLKCAQLILTNDEDLARWKEVAGMAEHGASTLGVIATTAAYTTGGQWLDQVVEYLDGNRRLMLELAAELMPQVRVRAPEGTYIALLDFRDTGLQGDLGEYFRTHAGVAMTDGLACGEAGIGMTRFVFAMPRPVLREALGRVADAVRTRAAA